MQRLRITAHVSSKQKNIPTWKYSGWTSVTIFFLHTGRGWYGSEIGYELFDYSLSILVGVSGDGVSLARFCRNLFRLHPSHRYRGGPLPLTRPRVATPAKLTPSPPKDLTRITMENVSGLVIFLRPDTVSLQYRVRSIPKKRKKYRKKINVTKCHD